MKFATLKWRGSAGRLGAAASGLDRWQRWAIGALICAITIGSISLVAHAGGRGAKKDETRATTTPTTEAGAEKNETKNTETNETASKPTPKATSGGAVAAPKKGGRRAGKTPPAKPQGQVIAITPPTKADVKEEEEEHEEDNVRARAQWFHDQRAYPSKYIPAGALQKALQQRDAMKLRQKASSGLHPASVITFPGDGLWHLTGPQPTNRPFGNFTGAGNSGFPTTSGRVTAVAVDPADTTGDTVYIGGAAGGVWKTTDGGTTWKSLTDSQPSLAIGSIAIDPNNHLTIYVGTGEDGFNHDGYYGAGILKSTDGGNTWTQLGASLFAVAQAPGVGGAQVGAIAVQPGNSSVVLAAVDFFDGNDPKGGIYQSLDGGTTWGRPAAGATGSAGTGVVFEPTSVASSTGAIAYAALGDIFSGATNNGIWKTTDSGAHWTKQAGGLPTTNVGRITLGYAASTSGASATVYAAIANSTPASPSSDLMGFFKTTNGGTAWSQLGSTPAFCNHQCFYDIAIGVDPRSANNVIVGGGAFTDNFTSLFESKDGGTTWTGTAADDFAGPNGGTHPHVDTHAIVFTPLGTTLRLYVGDDGGMWRTDNPLPSGVSPTWVGLNTQLALTQFYPNPSVGIGDDNSAFGGTQDNDTQVFSGTLDWTAVQACGDGASTAIDTLYPTSIYTTCAPGSGPGLVARSVFNGAVVAGPNPTFAPVDTGITTETMEFAPPLAIDSNNSATVYFATCRLWQTTNGQPTTDTTMWTAITGDLASGTNTLGAACGGAGDITSMDVSQQSSSIVFAGTSNGRVWKTVDATAGAASTWTEFDNNLLPNRFVTSVRTKRTDATGNIAYVTFSGFGSCAGCDGKGHVFETTNGGTTWSDISGDLPDAPVNDILVDHEGSPTHDALYIATDVGVFSCENPTAATPCQNWTVVGDGLPNSPVTGLAMRPSSRILRAFTHGRSAWHIQLTDVQPPPLAIISSMTPAAVMVAAATTQVTVTGINLSSNTQLLFDGIVIPTTFVNTTQLTAMVNTNLFTTGIVYNATVSDPAGADNGSLPFTVMNPVPTASSFTISTPTLTNDPVTLQFTGTNFVPGTVVTFNNLQVFGGTPSAGGTIFTVTVPAIENTTAGSIPVAIYNPLPGGGFAGSANITVTANPLVFNPSPIIQLGPINVGTTTAVLNVSITNVGATPINISAQSITGANPTNFSFAAPTSGTSCNFPTSGQSGTGAFTLTAGGGTCNFGMTFFANPATGNVDSTATLNVTDTAADSPQHIPIIGLINGANNLVTLSPVAFGGVAVGTTSPTMNSTLFNLSSTAISVNTAFSIAAGTNQADFHFVPFVASGDGNAACPTTVPFMLNPFTACDTSLTFTPSLPAGNETATINVTTSASGTPLGANLTGTGIELTSISPSVVATGGPAFTLTLNGGGFAPSAVVNVGPNGTNPRLTTFVSATQLLASIPASDIATPGSLAISVTTPVPGGTTSEPKTLIVAQAPPATNDNVNFATNAGTTPFRITQDTTQATTQSTAFTGSPATPIDPTPCATGSKAKSVWFQFKAPASGKVVADTRFSSYTTNLSAWTISTPLPSSTATFAPVACNTLNVPGTVAQSLITFPVTSGTTYYVMVTDATSATGPGGTLTFSLDFASAAPANDDNITSGATGPIVIAPATLPYSNTENTILATANTNGHTDPVPPCASGTGLASNGQANSVWYSFTPTSSGNFTADTLTSPYETILNVTSGSPTGAQAACNVNAGSGSTQVAQSQVTFAATGGTQYFIMVSSFLGDGGTTNFHLAANAGGAGIPASITATSGTPQTATISTAFGAPLAATVKDSLSNPVSGAIVTFTPPGSGDGGTFAGGVNTATTNASGVATSAVFTANATAGGPYNVAATVGGVGTPADFALTNKAGAAAKVAVTSGSGQSATISTAFAAPLVATVTDAGNNPVSGVVVTFTPPGSGASGTFAGGVNTATTNASGVATSAVFTANATAGGPYNVVASATGATSANFSLTNTAGTAAKVAVTSGSGQSATISTAFAAPLVATVTDAGNNPVSGVVVTFTPPGSGASGTFAGGVNTATTNASGVATSATFTANATAGGPYNVVASATGATSANFSLTNKAGAAAKVAATSGTPQSAAISTAFAAPLVATVTDAGNNPVSGVVVTFTPPGSGASGTFAGGVNTATTNASGVATSAVFTANATAGGPYNVVASATGAASANFSLTNTSGSAAKVAATSGTPQSATISTAFAAPLVATVTDAGNNPVSGVVVTFTPPGSGASGTFAGGVNTATTNASGVATSAVFTANSTAGGPYNVVASAAGATSANFSLTNKAGAAAKVAATSGTPQSATISTAFAAPLVATVTDSGNNPVSGVVVTFTPPGSGASSTFAGGVNTATTNASGIATSAVFTANATAGGPYNVVASATGATSANFSLTNKAGAAAKVAATSGTPQSATISTAFAAPLVATVTDSGNNPVSGVVVTFTPPGSGASGTFAGGVNTATTNASGVATSAVFTANATAGGPYNVVASATGATSANFALTNTTGAAAKVAATSGTPQSATISTAFAAPLVATVTDSGNNPVSAVVVTFTPPGSGASGTFAGGVNTATTNASGMATSAVFTANATAGGPYNVVASATGATSANFSLTNKAGAAAKVAATSGTPQSATISTAFAAPLVATVTDSGNNPVSGVVVTFTPPGSGASGTFAGGVNTATTNASGVATSAVFTANATAGGPYNVVASATGATSANFSLTNKAGAAAKVTATSGSGQSATISTAFAAPLVATVTDSGNNPVSGVAVTFTPPGSGASGTFAGGVNTATTNASGVATSPVFTANATAGGPYNVVASATGATSANFALTNTSTPPGKVAITTGSGQSATINTAFGAPFVVTVTDAGNNPVSGAVVTFTPPASGASGAFAGGVNTATTNASGVATSAVFTANATAGAYNVVASSPNDTPANFALTNTAGPAAKVTATSGTPQNAAINTAFAAPLVTTVTDAGNNPVSGVVVTFTPPASGASGTFAGGVNTATTNASGVATSAAFTANATAGGPYNVVASATGATSANFALTNNTGPAAKVAATSGSGQSTTISTAFAAPLVATVTDAGNNPVNGVVVTFTPPGSGASGTFAGGVNTATTNASGVATSAAFTANATAGGPYNVVASATGATSANFALTNKTGAAAKVAATSGTPQSVAISTAFAAPLVATVTDAGNNPVSGVVVTFTLPASGASGTFAGGVNTATTNASGVATSAVFTANATAGGPYNVVASATGATSANFSLTNLTGNPASVTATAGTPQGTPISTAFTTQLQATVKDAGSNPVSGVVVTFTPPASGASGTFAGGVNTATTNASGVATAPVFTANGTVGAYTVNATVAGVAAPAPFLLTNNAGPAASITATAGTPQSAVINTAFAAPLQATVKDAGSNPVSGVVVTFTAPASGASGTFAGGVNTATTNASGVATAAAFTANATAGSYTVTAKVSGVANGANFSLTNNPGPPASITATAGTPQTTTINTAFSTQLQATVKDAGNNLVSGAIVTFTAPASGASGGFAGGVNTATTNANGVATAPAFTANGTAGGPYTVTAKVAGVATTANFSLTNNNVQPTLASLLPASTLAGGATFPLTINGNNFVNGATVGFGADAALVPTTTTATQIVVNIPAADIAKAGQILVTVTNPPPSVGPSLAQTFTVNNPVPTLTTLGQTHIAGGTAFTLTVNGTNFVSTSVVNFGTKAEPTTLVSPTQVTAAIPATDVSTAGPVNVTVTNPAPGGGPTPTSIAFTVDGFSLAGPGAAVTVTAGMTATIPITITPTTNGFSNQVTFSVTGLPAHASLVPINATPGNAKSTVNLMITTTKRSAVPPVSPMDQPLTPMMRMLLVSWIAALLAGLYAALLIRRTPRLRRYAAIVPLALLLISGAVLAGCASAMNGTPVGTSQLTITATSGTLSQSTPATLTVQ